MASAPSSAAANGKQQQFHVKIAELQVAQGKKPAKEELIVRAIRPRDGMAGSKAKWETLLIDDNRAESVLLADAWGNSISHAKSKLKAGKVYRITNYIVQDKMKALPFGNNTIKITLTPAVLIQEGEDDGTLPHDLPAESLPDVVEALVPRITTLILAIDSPSEKKEITVRKTNEKRLVVNVTMKQKTHKIELSAWGDLATAISGQTGVWRLDAISVNPATSLESVKLSTLDCTTLRRATAEEAVSVMEGLSPDKELENLTKTAFVGRREAAMTRKARVATLVDIALALTAEFDAAQAGGDCVFDDTYEIASVMFISLSGPDSTNESLLTYKGCKACKYKKLGEDGKCSTCGGADFDLRYLLHVKMADPTYTVEGVVHHDSAQDFLSVEDLMQKPMVVLLHVGPDTRNTGKHAMEIFSVKPMLSATGCLNVFRAPVLRFHLSGDRVMPTVPAEVRLNKMSQSIVYDTYSSSVRLLVKITGDSETNRDDNVDGMRCELKAQCCVSGSDIVLVMAGSFDTIRPLYCLQKRQIVHAVCTTRADKNSDDLVIFKPIRLYAFSQEHAESVVRAFKFEVEEARIHYAKPAADPNDDTASTLKRKVQDNHAKESTGWASPKRRLKPNKTADCTMAGIQDNTP